LFQPKELHTIQGQGPIQTFLRKGGSIIEGIITTIAIICSGVIVGLIITAYAFHLTLLPLFKTIQDNLQVFTEYGEQRVKPAIDGGDTSFCSMPDGGYSAEEKVSVDEG
jgi:hypothetical protein